METFIVFTQKNILPLMPLVFVLVMLSQVVLGLLSALFRRSQVKVYPSGQIEIGLSQFGSTIALYGTFQSLEKDNFVSQIELLLKDSTGQTCRTFAWRAFKPYTFSLVPNKQEVILELVSAFLISAKAPFKYNLTVMELGEPREILRAKRKLKGFATNNHGWWLKSVDSYFILLYIVPLL